jgi:hypothetical protein
LHDDVVQLQQQVQQLQQAVLQMQLQPPQQPQQQQQEQRQQQQQPPQQRQQQQQEPPEPEELHGDQAVQAATAADGLEYEWQDSALYCVACRKRCTYQGHRTGKDHKKQVANLEWDRKEQQLQERRGLFMIMR